jgi:hypothetical protein
VSDDERERTTEPPPHPPDPDALPAPPFVPTQLSEISLLRDEVRLARQRIQTLLDGFAKLRKDLTDRTFTSLQGMTKLQSVCEDVDKRLMQVDNRLASMETASLTVPEAKI